MFTAAHHLLKITIPFAPRKKKIPSPPPTGKGKQRAAASPKSSGIHEFIPDEGATPGATAETQTAAASSQTVLLERAQ